jgi:hypothetical protein
MPTGMNEISVTYDLMKKIFIMVVELALIVNLSL